MSQRFSQLFDEQKSINEWYDFLGSISLERYIDFSDYIFDRLDDRKIYLTRLSNLIVAFARKEQEIARFMLGLNDDQRRSSLEISDVYFNMARSGLSEDGKRTLDNAREQEIKHGENFGWPSPLFDTFGAPPVFRKD